MRSKENSLFNPSDKASLLRPTWWMVILQVIVFIALYEVIALAVGFVAELLVNLLSYIPLIGTLIFGSYFGETLMYSITPIVIGIAVISIMGLIFKKYLYSAIALVLIIMYLSYTVISHLIYIGGEHGVISWNFANQVWFDIILCAIIFSALYVRSTLSIHWDKLPDNEIEDAERDFNS